MRVFRRLEGLSGFRRSQRIRVMRALVQAGMLSSALLLSGFSCPGDPAPADTNGYGVGMVVDGGAGQAGFTNALLPQPLVVRVFRTLCYNRDATTCIETTGSLPATSVTFAVVSGGGSVTVPATVPDINGKVSAFLTLGPTGGTTSVTATATWDASGSVNKPPIVLSFSASAVTRRVVMEIVSGDAQSATPGGTLPQPIVIKLSTHNLSGALAPLPNAAVQWLPPTNGGTLLVPTSTTDVQGMAAATWRLGSTVGAQSVTALVLSFPGADPTSIYSVDFRATARLAGARVLRVVSGDQQRGVVGRPELQPLVVEYVTIDPASGVASPVLSAAITFAPTSSSGSVTPSSTTTNSLGRATAVWTLGATPGAQAVHVSTPPVTGFDASSIFDIDVSSIAEPADLLLQDDFTTGTQWVTRLAQNDQDAFAHTFANPLTGGNPAGFRRMSHTLVKSTNPTFSTIFVEHMYTGGTYTPSKQGAIQTINYGEDHQGSTDTYSALLIVQNGVSYRALFPGGSVFLAPGWTTATLTGLRATDFQPMGLDFTVSGGTMQFGFVRGNSARFAPLTITHDIDNWSVLIRR